MAEFTITKEALDAIGSYLVDRPYREAAPLLQLINTSIKPHDPIGDVQGKTAEQFVAEQAPA